MLKVSIFSPASIPRRRISRKVVSYKRWWPLAIRSKLTLFRQCKLWHSDIPFTKASVLEKRANAFHGDTDPNPHRWSPTVLDKRKRKQSPPPISFRLSSRRTLLQIEDQSSALQLFSSAQTKDSSKPSCNEAICLQQLSRLQNDSAALREWTACVIFGFALRVDRRVPPSPMCFEMVATVSANIKRLFEIYPPNDELVFLALWYASRIIPQGVLDQFNLYQPDSIVVATRLFVLSYMLSIKWLADETCLLRDWVPHYQKGFSISSAKALDKAALELLDYNLYISPFQWTAWLHKLYELPSANILIEDRIHLVAQARIRKLLFKSEISSPCSRSESRSVSPSRTAIWKVHKILLDKLAISISFPEPAPWNPAEDPIIHARGRRQLEPFTQAPLPWSFGNHCHFQPDC